MLESDPSRVDVLDADARETTRRDRARDWDVLRGLMRDPDRSSDADGDHSRDGQDFEIFCGRKW